MFELSISGKRSGKNPLGPGGRHWGWGGDERKAVYDHDYDYDYDDDYANDHEKARMARIS
jgi:hypothetical protein